MYALKNITRTVVTLTACTALVMDTLERDCCVRGHHTYAHIWEAAVGEVLLMDCRHEPDNANDRYAMAVVKSDTIVGHLPRKLSRVYRCLQGVVA